MNYMKFPAHKKVILFLAILLTTISCENKSEPKGFQLPKDISIDKENFFNPLYVDNIFGSPNRSEIIWNSAFLKKCGIKKFMITKNKHLKKGIEKINYSFNKEGFPVHFQFFNDSKKPFSKSNFYYNNVFKLDSIKVVKFLGINSGNSLKVDYESDSKINFNYIKTEDKQDQIQYFYNKGLIEMIVKRIGNTIVQVEFISEEGIPIKKLKSLIKKEIQSDDDLLYADKSLTYIKNNLPIATYTINSDWAQTERVKEWNYDQNNKLITFKEWGNQVVIKDLIFEYSEQGILNQVTFNKDQFTFDYN